MPDPVKSSTLCRIRSNPQHFAGSGQILNIMPDPVKSTTFCTYPFKFSTLCRIQSNSQHYTGSKEVISSVSYFPFGKICSGAQVICRIWSDSYHYSGSFIVNNPHPDVNPCLNNSTIQHYCSLKRRFYTIILSWEHGRSIEKKIV